MACGRPAYHQGRVLGSHTAPFIDMGRKCMLQSLSTHKLLPDREDKDNLEVLRKQNRRNTREVSMLPLSARNATEVSTLAFECKKCKRGEHASL